MTLEKAKKVLVEVGIDAIENKIMKYGKEKNCLTVGGGRVKVNLYEEMIEDIWTEMALVTYVEQLIAKTPDFNIDKLTSKEYVMDHVVSCVRHETMDESIVKFSVMGDLEEYLRVVVNEVEGSEGFMSIVVTKDFAKNLKLDVDELRAAGRKNLEKKVSIRSMSAVMSELIDMSEGLEDLMPADDVMYVGSTNDKQYGAAVMLLDDVLERFCKARGILKLCIIPSSVHECLLIVQEMEEESVNGIIQEVNETQVVEEERLSSHCYYYFAK